MRQCKRCYSYAINPDNHGRKKGIDLNLCDVCYWRKRAEELKSRTVKGLLSNSTYRDMIRYLVDGARSMAGSLHPDHMDDVREYIEEIRQALLVLVDYAAPKRKYKKKR